MFVWVPYEQVCLHICMYVNTFCKSTDRHVSIETGG